MIGRMEITEILGMAGTCALVLFAGFGVETLEGNVQPSWAVTAAISAPDLPDAVELPDEVHLTLPHLERPVHPAPPPISVEPLDRLTARSCACEDKGS
jgi:hypothetical protein